MLIWRENSAKLGIWSRIQLRVQSSAVKFFGVSVTKSMARRFKLTLLELSPVSGCQTRGLAEQDNLQSEGDDDNLSPSPLEINRKEDLAFYLTSNEKENVVFPEPRTPRQGKVRGAQARLVPNANAIECD